MNKAQRIIIAVVSCVVAALLFLAFGPPTFSGDQYVGVFLGLVTPVALVGLAFFVNAGGKGEPK